MKFQRAFTLVEILIVLVVISVMVGLATIAMTPNPHNALTREARRLQVVLQMAADEAVMQGMQWALALPENGYQFLVFDTKQTQWIPVDIEPFNLYTLDDSMTLTLTIEGEQLDPQVMESVKRMQSLNADSSIFPVLLLLSSGEITPFSMALHYDQLDSSVVLRSDGVSPIELIDGVID